MKLTREYLFFFSYFISKHHRNLPITFFIRSERLDIKRGGSYMVPGRRRVGGSLNDMETKVFFFFFKALT